MGKKGKSKGGRYVHDVIRCCATGKSAGVALADIQERQKKDADRYRRVSKTNPTHSIDGKHNLAAYDFHGMTVKDAGAWLGKKMSENRRGECESLVLITGKGKRSKQPVSPVKKRVEKILREQKREFENISGGGAFLVKGKQVLNQKAFTTKVSAQSRYKKTNVVSANRNATFAVVLPSSTVIPGISYSDMLKSKR
jgi:hypothetical protein